MTQQNQMDSFLISALTCPITLELFVNPVLADDGHTYERSAIIEWVKNHKGTSPITRQAIKISQLKENRVVKQLADQYRSKSTFSIETKLPIFFANGTLLDDDQKKLFNGLFRKQQKWSLIYKATENGFNSYDFHRYCTHRGATLTLIQVCHNVLMKKRASIFGGYTTVPWTSKHGFYRDPQAFLFLLRRNGFTRFNLKSSKETAISHYPTEGPVFGLDDIHICHRANEYSMSYSKFPHCYKDLDKNGKGRKTFSKSEHFLVNEIEVYTVIL